MEGSPSTAGSLAVPVRDPSFGEERLLTAAHVAGALNKDWGYRVPTEDARPDEDRVKVRRIHTNDLGATHTGSIPVGHADRSCPDDLDDEWTMLECPVDAVLIEPLEGIEAGRDIGEGLTAHGEYYEDPADLSMLHLRVYKLGAKTGLTSGLITQVGVSLTAWNNPRGPIQYPLCFSIMSDTDGRPFAQRGDSGSAVVDERGRLVGLLVAMEDDEHDPSALAYAIPFAMVISELGVQLIGPGGPYRLSNA